MNEMEEIIIEYWLLVKYIILLIALKSFTIGSSFNFYKWATMKGYYKKYCKWLDLEP